MNNFLMIGIMAAIAVATTTVVTLLVVIPLTSHYDAEFVEMVNQMDCNELAQWIEHKKEISQRHQSIVNRIYEDKNCI